MRAQVCRSLANRGAEHSRKASKRVIIICAQKKGPSAWFLGSKKTGIYFVWLRNDKTKHSAVASGTGPQGWCKEGR